MSKKLLNDLLKEAYSGQEAKRKQLKMARTRIDSVGYHLIDIPESDIYEILIYNYVAIRKSKSVTKARKALIEENAEDTSRQAAAKKVVEGDDVNATKLRDEAKKLSSLIYSKFVQEYNSTIQNVEHHAKYTRDGIKVLQPKNHADKLKQTLMNILKSNAAGTMFNNFTAKQYTSFSRRTQFLHKGRTVGTQVLEDLASLKSTGDSKAKGAALEVIMEMIESVDWGWDLKDTYEGRIVSVRGSLGQTLANKPGAESTDWTRLRPKLEADLAARLSEYGYGVEASQPFDERLAKYLINEEIIEPIIKGKGKKGKPFKVEKPKNKKNSVPGKKAKDVKGGALKTGGRRKRQATSQRKSRKAAPSYISLIGILNNKLPDVVRKNMQEPYLVNRTGRFAGSVRVTDVMTTRQGFPSIGYTYQKSPYQTFETGFAKGDEDRDPRKVIDRSIREIAAQMAIGRFYTRRV